MYVCVCVKGWAIKSGPCTATFNDLLNYNNNLFGIWLLMNTPLLHSCFIKAILGLDGLGLFRSKKNIRASFKYLTDVRLDAVVLWRVA
jgi:hypothetical protein